MPSVKVKRKVKKPSKRLIRLCIKNRIKVTRKVGKRKVYKSTQQLKKQLKLKLKKVKRVKKRVKRSSRFGAPAFVATQQLTQFRENQPEEYRATLNQIRAQYNDQQLNNVINNFDQQRNQRREQLGAEIAQYMAQQAHQGLPHDPQVINDMMEEARAWLDRYIIAMDMCLMVLIEREYNNDRVQVSRVVAGLLNNDIRTTDITRVQRGVNAFNDYMDGIRIRYIPANYRTGPARFAPEGAQRAPPRLLLANLARAARARPPAQSRR
jgi:hypothetical protein